MGRDCTMKPILTKYDLMNQYSSNESDAIEQLLQLLNVLNDVSCEKEVILIGVMLDGAHPR